MTQGHVPETSHLGITKSGISEANRVELGPWNSVPLPAPQPRRLNSPFSSKPSSLLSDKGPPGEHRGRPPGTMCQGQRVTGATQAITPPGLAQAEPSARVALPASLYPANSYSPVKTQLCLSLEPFWLPHSQGKGDHSLAPSSGYLVVHRSVCPPGC